MKRIFSVTTKKGIITRESQTKEYTYAILTDMGNISTWCSRLDLAQKAAKGTTWTKGGTIVEVVELDKQPADANPGMKLEEGYNKDNQRRYLITDTDGKQYVGNYDEFQILTDDVELTQLHTMDGYLDRLYNLYSFNGWKAEQDAAKAAEAEANKDSKAGDAKIQKLHEIEAGSIKPETGVSWHKHKSQWEVKPCISGKRYFAGYYKKENLDAANQAAVAVKAAGSEKAQEVADCWKIIRKDQAL